MKKMDFSNVKHYLDNIDTVSKGVLKVSLMLPPAYENETLHRKVKPSHRNETIPKNSTNWNLHSAKQKDYGILSSIKGLITMSWTQPSSFSIHALIIFAMVSGFR